MDCFYCLINDLTVVNAKLEILEWLDCDYTN